VRWCVIHVFRGCGDFLLRAIVSLRQCERDRENARKQEEVKRTSNQVRFDSGMKLFFHRGVVDGERFSLEPDLVFLGNANPTGPKETFELVVLSSDEPEWLRSGSELTETLISLLENRFPTGRPF